MPAVNCPICANPLACAHCGQHLDAEELAEQLGDNLKGRPLHGTDTGEPRGSSGRIPMWDTSPRARRDFLDTLGVRGRAQAVQSHVEQEQGDTPAFIARLAAAERLVEACEKDRDDAYAELRYARADEPEQARYRAVTPERAWDDSPGLSAVDRDRR